MDRDKLLSHKLTNWLHSAVLLAGMAGLLAILGWIMAGPEGVVWTVLLGVGLLLFAPRVSPRVLLRMYGAWPLRRADTPGLHHLVLELARRAGLDAPPRLYYLPSPVVNAFTLGQRDDAALVVSDGLLRALGTRELAGVLAHEIAHVRSNDMWVMGLADLVSRLTSALSLAGMVLLVLTLPMMLVGQSRVSPLAPLILVFAPTLSALLQLALSRAREYDADLEAARLTGDPRGLASALHKIEHQGGSWLARILLPGRRVPEPSLLRTHPPTEERVRRLLSLEPEPAARPVRVAVEPLWVQRAPPRRAPRWRFTGLWH